METTPELGISRALARQRAAQLREVTYRVNYLIKPAAEQLEASSEISFILSDLNAPVVVDFKGLSATAEEVNGKLLEARANNQLIKNVQQINGHIVIPIEYLQKGENQLSFNFLCPARKSGAAITRYLDQDDQSEYLYTLFVPSDAHMAFPCFDQPDLKARFVLDITAPADWKVITNTMPSLNPPAPTGFKRTVFQQTKPLSTYLFAFAAGPFLEMPIAGEETPLRMFARRSKAAKAKSEFDEIARLNREGLRVLGDYFDYRYPFDKYDIVIVPEFAYGGMEHAGASFFREDRMLFPTDPTPNDLVNRAELILHEAAHQWFGDLITMRWFDDLWLKEGFATFMAYHAMEKVLPQDVWRIFYQKNKPRAYSTDITKGTTPIYQEIPNLRDAKSAYGNIVYTKAPSMLRQFEFYLGAPIFQKGVRDMLKKHAFDNAEWSDLIKACEAASGQSLTRWADAWVKRRGLAVVEADWSVKGEKIDKLVLKQQNILAEGGDWPMKIELLLGYHDRAPETLTVRLNDAVTEVKEAAGKPRPDYIFTNYQDYGYGQFRLDARSLAAVKTALPNIREEFLRALLWGALWDAVREAELPPLSYLELAISTLPNERDGISTQLILNNVTTAYSRYLSKSQQNAIAEKLEALVFDRMLKDPDLGLRLTYFRAAPTLISSDAGRARLKEILKGELNLPGITLKPKDRWDIVTALVSQSDSQSEELLKAEQVRDSSDDGRRYAFIAAAARADKAVKQQYFQRYLSDRELAESWIENSLGAFNTLRQADETLPYLKPALAVLPELKKTRKIFFINGWLDAFIGGQQSAAALDIVEEFLKQQNLDRDLRLKILETVDRLERTVKIRAKYAL